MTGFEPTTLGVAGARDRHVAMPRASRLPLAISPQRRQAVRCVHVRRQLWWKLFNGLSRAQRVRITPYFPT